MTWEVGDLAVCVNTDNLRTPGGVLSAGKHLTIGSVYRVVGVKAPLRPDTPGPILSLKEVTEPAGAWRFRKIRPDEHESCEPEFVALLKRSKAPSPQEREKRILEALFPQSTRGAALPNKRAAGQSL